MSRIEDLDVSVLDFGALEHFLKMYMIYGL